MDDTKFMLICLLVTVVAIGGAFWYGQTNNPPPSCVDNEVAVHYGTNGGWACVIGEPK